MPLIPITPFAIYKVVVGNVSATQLASNMVNVNLNSQTGTVDFYLMDATNTTISSGQVAITPAQLLTLASSGAVPFMKAVATSYGLTPS